jgi:hypothetical protein
MRLFLWPTKLQCSCTSQEALTLRHSAILLFLGAALGYFAPTVNNLFSGWIHERRQSVPIAVKVCSPLQDLTLVVNSRLDDKIKVHSARPAPAVQNIIVHIANNLVSAIEEIEIAVSINQHLSWDADLAFFFSNSILNTTNYHVHKDRFLYTVKNAKMMGGEELVLEFITPLPASVFIEVGSRIFSMRDIYPAGYCDIKLDSATILRKEEFFRFENNTEHPNFIVDDISDPIGPVFFDLHYTFNCGDGMKSNTIPYGGEYGVCGATLMPMPEGQRGISTQGAR